jgi:Sec-independent protein secretion pathway component TatC
MSDKPEHDQPMPLVSHLTELRTRLLRCIAAIFIIFAGLFAFTQQIYTLVSTPLREYLPVGATMIATDVASPFLTPLKLTMMVSLFIAIPVILHQSLGLYRSPACTSNEKRIAVPLLVSSHFPVLRRHGLRLLPGVPAGVQVFRRRHPGRRGDDDRYQQLPRLRHDPVLCLRRGL